MKILSIGNSFSQDSHRWLSQIAESHGDSICAVNLYIGGCSLQTHWNNFCSREPAYSMEVNGTPVRKIDLIEALQLEAWDVVTLQQASPYSGEPDSYEPYLTDLHREVRQLCPGAKIWICQTWAYERDTIRPSFSKYNNDQEQMYAQLSDAYAAAAERLSCGLIPVGSVIQYLRTHVPAFDYANGGMSLNRDGLHLSYIYGRYAAALTWYGTLFGAVPAQSRFIPKTETETGDPQILDQIHQAVRAVLGQ